MKLGAKIYGKLDRDISKELHTKDVYYDARNMRNMAHKDQSSGAMETISGTSLDFTIPNCTKAVQVDQEGNTVLVVSTGGVAGTITLTGDHLTRVNAAPVDQFTDIKPIGGVAGRDSVFVIATAETGATPAATSMGSIWEYNRVTSTLRLLYFDAMNISQAHPVEMLHNYENTDVEKLYWWGDLNYLRHINVRRTDLANQPLDFLDVASNAVPNNIQIDRKLHGTGTFKSGSVCWAYSYVNRNGAETQISPESPLVAISDNSTGNPYNEDVAVSFELSISGLRSDFDLIRIYRIHYTDKIAAPIITLIAEDELQSTTYSYVDDGTRFVSSVGLTEYLLLGSEPFKANAAASKDNRLFPAGIKENQFLVDLDTRAYRFNSSGSLAEIFDKDGVSLNVSSTNWNSVPEKHDAINKSTRAETDRNSVTGEGFGNDPTYYDLYSYTTGGVRGAEGPNVLITEVANSIDNADFEPVSEQTVGFVKEAKGKRHFGVSLFNLQGFKRDEIYRLGVVFYNKFGQRSFVSWLCDYRIGDLSENPLASYSTGRVRDIHLYISFKSQAITALQAQGIVGYQFVRVPRTSSDKTIMCSGMIGCLTEGGSGDTFQNNKYTMSPYMSLFGLRDVSFTQTNSQIPVRQNLSSPTTAFQYLNNVKGTSWAPYLCEFRSIELDENTPTEGYFKITNAQKVSSSVIFNKEYDESSATLSTSNNWSVSNTVTPKVQSGDPNYHNQLEPLFTSDIAGSPEIEYGNVTINPTSNVLNFQAEDTVIGISASKVDGSTISIGSKVVFQTHGGKFADNFTNDVLVFRVGAGTTGVYDDGLTAQLLNKVFPLDTVSPHAYMMMADYKRLLPNQYGGSSYADRSRNQYVVASRYFDIEESLTTVDYTKDVTFGDSFTTVHHYQRSYPAYTDITTKSGHRDLYQYYSESQVAEPLRIYAGTITRKPTLKFEESEIYNAAYDRKHDARVFFAEPLTVIDTTNKFNEVKYSDAKIPGESVDSWLNYAEGNVGYLDGGLGEITAIYTGPKDDLWIWQEHGFGVYAINPSVIQSDTAGNAVFMGTGEVLQKFAYVSRTSGLQHTRGIASSPYGFIWYDAARKAVQSIGADRAELDLMGINSYINSLGTFGNNPVLGSGVVGVFNSETNETSLFFNESTTTGEGVVFNHTKKAWSHFVDGQPSMHIDYHGLAILPKAGSREIYRFGDGDQGSMFGTVYPSSVTVIIAEPPGVVKFLDNLFWNSECYNTAGIDQPDKTANKIRIYNDHQDSGLIDLGRPDLVRLLREWRYVVPDAGRLERFQSQYFFVQLYTDNAENLKLILQSLKYRYRPHPVPFM